MYLCFYIKSETISNGLIQMQLEYQKEKRERMGEKIFFGLTMAENIPKFMIGTKPQIQEA